MFNRLAEGGESLATSAVSWSFQNTGVQKVHVKEKSVGEK